MSSCVILPPQLYKSRTQDPTRQPPSVSKDSMDLFLDFVVAVLPVSVLFLYSEGKAALCSLAMNVNVLTSSSASFESFNSSARASLLC